MLLRRIPLKPEGCEAIRMVCICLLGIAVGVVAMTVRGWGITSLALAGLMLLMGAALVLQVFYVFRRLTDRSVDLQRAAVQAEEHHVKVLWRIVRFIEARDKYTRGHSQRVGQLAEQIAGRMGLDPRRCALLNKAGRLHDIGLLATPAKILAQHCRLGVDAFHKVRKHSEIGYEVLKPLDSLAPVLPAVLHHHERMNGTGYPRGLQGDEIPLEARILAVADAYDAMTHDRPHRSAMSPYLAMQELCRCTPAGFDADCVEALGEIVHLPRLEEVLAG